MSKGYYSVNMHGCANGIIPVPVIGENGNWFIGNEDTKVAARGEQGVAGPEGPQGATGETIDLSPYETITESTQKMNNALASANTYTDTATINMASRATGATTGNILTADENGNPVDSGKNTNDFLFANSAAASAVKLETSRTINGVPFDGTSDISIIAASAVYSTTETLTDDTWIDGKPIYNMVLAGTFPAIDGTVSTLGIISDLEMIIPGKFSAIATDKSGGMISLPYTALAGTAKMILSFTADKAVVVGVTGASTWLNQPVTVIINYTKK